MVALVVWKAALLLVQLSKWLVVCIIWLFPADRVCLSENSKEFFPSV